jgi:predicted nucleic acid-binding protein
MAAITRIVVGFDSGALIALSRGNVALRAFLRVWASRGVRLLVPAPVLAEVLRGGARDAALHRVLRNSGVEIVPLSAAAARRAGELLGSAGAKPSYTLDALIVAVALESGVTEMFTSDSYDIELLAGDAFTVVGV